MISKNELKNITSLKSKKGRVEQKQLLLEGFKLIMQASEAGIIPSVILVTSDFVENSADKFDLVAGIDCRIEQIKRIEFNKITETENPQGVVAVIDIPEFYNITKVFELAKAENEKILFLDNVNDPGNAGTIMRTADWFGYKYIVFSDNSVEVTNPKVVRACMGSLFTLNCVINCSAEELSQAAEANGYDICITDLDGNNIFSEDYNSQSVVVFSNEAAGPSKEIKAFAKKIITIPKFGNVESLNVAAAAAVVLSELRRKNG